ncbi:MAG: sterol desaturase family protein [Reichenbachiella sp.]|uniref:sterol desaturase family protein n=1 Tax=Reichenbachiella sp. TaxID=2184521 RepID=UPI003264E520
MDLIIAIGGRVMDFVIKFMSHYWQFYKDSYPLLIFYFSLPVLFFLIEILLYGWEQSSLKKILKPNGSELNDIVGFIFVQTRINEILGYGLLLGVALYIPKGVRSVFGYNLIQNISSPWIQALIAFFVIDFLAYWIHRLEHWYRPFWEMHKYHHASTSFNFLSAHRTHPISNVSLKRIIQAIPIAIMGTPVVSYLFVLIAKRVLVLLQHSELHWDFGWVGRYIILSPAAHRVHHAVDEKYYNKNFGFILIIWDRIFGTWSEPDLSSKPVIGLVDNQLNHPNYFVNIFHSSKIALQHLIGRTKNN